MLIRILTPMESVFSALPLVFTLILFTSFIKVATGLNILRIGLGLHGVGLGLIVTIIALPLALLPVQKELQQVDFSGRVATQPSSISSAEVIKALSPFIERNTTPSATETITKLSGSVEPNVITKVSAFILSDLTVALKAACMMLIPFVIVDLFIAYLIALLGITQLPVALVSIPLKLLLFLSVNGWSLVFQKLLGGNF